MGNYFIKSPNTKLRLRKIKYIYHKMCKSSLILQIKQLLLRQNKKLF